MKLERDKKYLDRSGDVTRIIFLEGPDTDYPAIGMAEEGDCYSYSLAGKFSGDDKRYDLISEVKEPREFWISLEQQRIYEGEGFSKDGLIKVREVLEGEG